MPECTNCVGGVWDAGPDFGVAYSNPASSISEQDATTDNLLTNATSFSSYLSIYLDLFHNKPYSTAKRKNSGTGRTRLTAYSRTKKLKNENESSYNKY